MTKSAKDRRIDYVEFSVGNIARSRDFYGKAFDWTFKDHGPGYCEFTDGHMSGGFSLAGGSAPASAGGPLVILFADSLEECQGRVEKAGGKIVKPAYGFPGGRRFHFADPDGYELAVWSDK